MPSDAYEVNNIDHHWIILWLGAKLKITLGQLRTMKKSLKFEYNEFENVSCKMVTILSGNKCINNTNANAKHVITNQLRESLATNTCY